MRDTFVPLNSLVHSPLNVRKEVPTEEEIESLAADIEDKRLLQNLVILPNTDGTNGVVAGERRRLALQLLMHRGSSVYTENYLVAVKELEEGDDPEAISLAENIKRKNMNPADEFEAFERQIAGGKTDVQVAHSFGVPLRHVRQRMKLARVSPRLVQALRDGKISLPALEAFAVSDDHAAQERVFSDANEWTLDNPDEIRAQLTDALMDAGDHLAQFATLEAYRAAGGVVHEDLFSDAVYLEDRELVCQLASERLTAEAQQVKDEGWAWVVCKQLVDNRDTNGYDRIYAEPRELTKPERRELQRLERELGKLTAADSRGELAEEDLPNLQEVQAKVRALKERTFTNEQMASAGAFVSINRGQLLVQRGFAERKKARKATRTDAGSPNAPAEERDYSGQLTQDLSAQRTAALRLQVATNPRIALVGTLHSLLRSTMYRGDPADSCFRLNVAEEPYMAQAAPDGCTAFEKLYDLQAAWRKRLPKRFHDVWDWLLTQEDKTLNELLAVIASMSVNAVERADASQYSGREYLKHADQLAGALNLDMAEWWEPTANFLSRISKAQILAAIGEACGSEQAESLKSMKKAALVGEAQKLLAETGWLPGRLAAPQAVRSTTVEPLAA